MITVKLEGMEEALAVFDPKVVRQAARAGIDRATKSGRTIVSKEITDVWNVKKKDVDPRIKLTAPRMDDLKGVIEVGGKGMSLSYFGARQIMGATVRSRVGQNLKTGKVTRGMRSAGPLPQGVVVQVLKGKDTALLRNAFLSKVTAGRSGSHIGVYRRLTGKRLPIEEKNVISIASMVNRPEVINRVVDRIIERWNVEFPRQLDYFMSKRGR
ncbi:MAG: hypothetical protein PHN84_12800 [Desulfuromonadaceae bacterium]|nr:hypothetical protein [Desulfuromonadaceae bacterium]